MGVLMTSCTGMRVRVSQAVCVFGVSRGAETLGAALAQKHFTVGGKEREKKEREYGVRDGEIHTVEGHAVGGKGGQVGLGGWGDSRPSSYNAHICRETRRQRDGRTGGGEQCWGPLAVLFWKKV